MRPRIWVIIVAVVLALGFGFTGRATDTGALDSLAGLAWLVAIIVAISLLPFWAKIIPRLEAMPGLFQRPLDGQRWCTHCGTATVKAQACEACGAEPKMAKETASKKSGRGKKPAKKPAS